MCGLAGVVSWRSAPACLAPQKILRGLARRGPDAQGLLAQDWFTLFHTRLSILDPTWRGSQPISDASRRYVMAYNGEIYNFRELNAQLAARGARLQSSCDSETLVESFAAEGPSAFAAMSGMFAGAIVDRAERTLYLFRDRLGVKPLYFRLYAGGAAFASTPEIVSELCGGLPIDEAQASRHLAFRSAAADASFYRGVEALRPGVVLKLGVEERNETPFWRLAEHFGARAENFDASQSAEELGRHVEQAVRSHTVSDAPVAAFLSGGLDSTIIVDVLAQTAEAPHAYSFGSLVAETDETERAARSARAYGAGHTIVAASLEDPIASLCELTGLKGAPLSVANELAIYRMAQRMAGRHKVVLSGEGADELLLGYSNIFRRALQTEQAPRSPFAMAEWIFEQYCYVKPAALRRAGFGEGFVENYVRAGKDYVHALIAELPDAGLSDRLQYFFFRHHLPVLLMRLDNATMAASVEGRVPFTDHKLVEFALRLPKTANLTPASGAAGKQMLYRAFSRLPRWVLDQPKIGFKPGDPLAGAASLATVLKSAGLNEELAHSGEISADERWAFTSLALFARRRDWPLRSMM